MANDDDTTEVTEEYLQMLDALEETATKGPWRARDRSVEPDYGVKPSIIWCNIIQGYDSAKNHYGVSWEEAAANAAFVAASRRAVELLKAEVRRLRKQLSLGEG